VDRLPLAYAKPQVLIFVGYLDPRRVCLFSRTLGGLSFFAILEISKGSRSK